MVTYIARIVHEPSSNCPQGQKLVNLDGPHGKLGLNLDAHEYVLLVAGGMGITPMISIFVTWPSEERRVSHLKKCMSYFRVRTQADVVHISIVSVRRSMDSRWSSMPRHKDTESVGRVHNGHANIENIVSVLVMVVTLLR